MTPTRRPRRRSLWLPPSRGRAPARLSSVAAPHDRAELPLVLTDVSFVVEARQKIGVCGRTGSGKSTLMQLLFRIIELDSGSIKIDGIDISTIGLRQLRTGIAILPQDPTLFAGTVRDNIE